MSEEKDILYGLAKRHGYPEGLCRLLQVREEACRRLLQWWEYGMPFIDVLREGIEDSCAEVDLVKMALGNMEYTLRCDFALEDEDPKITDRRCAMESGERGYRHFLSSDGGFDYQKCLSSLKDGQLPFPDEEEEED